MPKIYVVRHGEAAAGFGADADPGLSLEGRRQAEQTAQDLKELGPLAIYTSPLARARETAAPLAALWNVPPIVEPRIAEIPSPTSDLEARATWLRGVMRGPWSDLSADLKTWRRELIDWVVAAPRDAVFFSHFVAINLLAGEAAGSADMVVFRPAYCSITSFDTATGRLTMIGRGDEGETRVT